MGPIGSKVIEVKGQIYGVFLLVMFFSVCSPTSPRSSGRSSPNFRIFQGHRGQRSNFYISAVLGPIYIKLGEYIQVDP